MRRPFAVSLLEEDIEAFGRICQDSECGASETFEVIMQALISGQMMLIKNEAGLSLYYQPDLDTDELLETHSQLRQQLETRQEQLQQLQSRFNLESAALDESRSRIAALEQQLEAAKQQPEVTGEPVKEFVAVDLIPESLLEGSAAMSELLAELLTTDSSQVLAERQVVNSTVYPKPEIQERPVVNFEEETSVKSEEQHVVNSEEQPPVEAEERPVVNLEEEPQIEEPPVVTKRQQAVCEVSAELPDWLKPDPKPNPKDAIDEEPKSRLSPSQQAAEAEIEATVDLTPTTDLNVLQQRARQMAAIYGKHRTQEEEDKLQQEIDEGLKAFAESRRQEERAGHQPPKLEEQKQKAILAARTASANGEAPIARSERGKVVREVFGKRARPMSKEDEQVLLKFWGQVELSKEEDEERDRTTRNRPTIWPATKTVSVQSTRQQVVDWLAADPKHALIRACAAYLEIPSDQPGQQVVKEKARVMLESAIAGKLPTEDELNEVLEFLVPAVTKILGELETNA